MRLHRLTVCFEDDGSVYLLELPGCVSQGENRAEALRNLVEALGALLESYHDDAVPVPWEKTQETMGFGGSFEFLLDEPDLYGV